jgi:hypothetical protein
MLKIILNIMMHTGCHSRPEITEAVSKQIR